MTAMFGDLQGLRLEHIEDLPADGVPVTVGIRQRRAAACADGGIMIHDVVRVLDLHQGGSLVARWPPLGLADLPRWLRVRFRTALFSPGPSLAGGLELVVLSRAALRSIGSAIRSRKRAFSRSSASFSLTSAAPTAIIVARLEALPRLPARA